MVMPRPTPEQLEMWNNKEVIDRRGGGKIVVGRTKNARVKDTPAGWVVEAEVEWTEPRPDEPISVGLN